MNQTRTKRNHENQRTNVFLHPVIDLIDLAFFEYKTSLEYMVFFLKQEIKMQ